TITVPGGSTVQTGDGPKMTLPEGGTVDPGTGAITPDEGGSVVIDTGDGTTTITPPSGQPVTPNDDGSVTIPPEGGTLQPGGEVEYTVTVTFDSQGGSQVPSQDITVGEPVSQPDDPTRTGYRFLGWYTAATGGARWDFTQPVTGDQTLYAQWAYLPPANPNYKITIGDTENGTVTVNPTPPRRAPP
ncbi:MAG: InlB B-repeat-containing protein, partial [Evtepia sp.]